MDFEQEFNNLMELGKKDLAQGKKIRYPCPYCGISLSGLFEKKKYHQVDNDETDWEDEEILCPCCGQAGAF